LCLDFAPLAHKFSSTDNARLDRVIQRIQACSLVYSEAIDRSLKTAQSGIGLGSDVIDLCGHLKDLGINSDDLQEYILGLQKKKELASDDAAKTLAKFGEVRRSLTEVSTLHITNLNDLFPPKIKNQIPKEVVKDNGIAKRFGRNSVSALCGLDNLVG